MVCICIGISDHRFQCLNNRRTHNKMLDQYAALYIARLKFGIVTCMCDVSTEVSGDQTLKQKNIYDSYVRYSWNLENIIYWCSTVIC